MKEHKKMYKSGKSWIIVTIAVTILSITGAASQSNHPVAYAQSSVTSSAATSSTASNSSTNTSSAADSSTNSNASSSNTSADALSIAEANLKEATKNTEASYNKTHVAAHRLLQTIKKYHQGKISYKYVKKAWNVFTKYRKVYLHYKKLMDKADAAIKALEPKYF